MIRSVVILALAIFGIISVTILTKDEDNKKSIPLVTGLEPGDQVVFQARDSEGITITKDLQADQSGVVLLPNDYFSSGEQNFVSYMLNFDSGDDLEPLTVLVDVDPDTQNLSVSGSGLKSFTDISLKQNGEILETRADWTGVFKDLEMDPPKEWEKPVDRLLRLSMRGQSWIADTQEADRDRVIEVQFFSPQGSGGGPTSSNVNSLSVSGCGSNPPLSICDEGKVKATIDDLVGNYVGALMSMAEQLSAVAMQQTLIIGTFFDAKHQLETQQKIQMGQVSAQKDYFPSDQMCRFGSFTRGIAHAESKADHDKMVINEFLMARYLNKEGTAAAEGSVSDFPGQIELYKTAYCDPGDNNGGLADFCEDNDSERVNKDIDFTRTVGSQLTLNADFRASGSEEERNTETDILSLAKHLYSPVVLTPTAQSTIDESAEGYMDVRRLAAFQNIAHNSFANYVSMKTKAPDDLADESGGAYMKTLLRDFGMSDEDIVGLLGESPSYHAQMDVLTKKIYQDPDFYTNLYDKPVNVERIGVSMRAIGLMNARDQYESALRKEMLLSMLVEDALADRTETAIANMFSDIALPGSF